MAVETTDKERSGIGRRPLLWCENWGKSESNQQDPKLDGRTEEDHRGERREKKARRMAAGSPFCPREDGPPQWPPPREGRRVGVTAVRAGDPGQDDHPVGRGVFHVLSPRPTSNKSNYVSEK